jgi:hypothetical protein
MKDFGGGGQGAVAHLQSLPQTPTPNPIPGRSCPIGRGHRGNPIKGVGWGVVGARLAAPWTEEHRRDACATIPRPSPTITGIKTGKP